jgi:hypothetical protein
MITHNHQDHLDTTLTQYLVISLLSQNLNKSKMLNKLFSIVCSVCFVAIGVVCLCCVNSMLNKASDTHSSTYFYYFISVLPVVCMIGCFSKKFMQC